MPKMAGIFAFVAIASLGLPGLAGFWGEVMALLSLVPTPPPGLNVGAVPRVHDLRRDRHDPHRRLLPVDAAAGEHGRRCPRQWKEHGFRDILAVEWVAWAPLLALVVVLGLFPSSILNMTDDGVDAIVSLPCSGLRCACERRLPRDPARV